MTASITITTTLQSEKDTNLFAIIPNYTPDQMRDKTIEDIRYHTKVRNQSLCWYWASTVQGIDRRTIIHIAAIIELMFDNLAVRWDNPCLDIPSMEWTGLGAAYGKLEGLTPLEYAVKVTSNNIKHCSVCIRNFSHCRKTYVTNEGAKVCGSCYKHI